MYRGTTPTNMFTVDIDLTTATKIYITYKQQDRVAIEKSLPDIEVASDKLTVILTQEDTLKLAPGKVDMQIRALFPDHTAVASDIIETTAERILKDGKI